MNQPETTHPEASISVLFVCTGNTCRSPLAEILARQNADERGMPEVEFRSAGVHTDSGLPASMGARGVARRHGLSLEDHSSSTLTGELVDWADWIFAMGPGHLKVVESLGGGGKSGLLGVFANGGGLGGQGMDQSGGEIRDPYGGSDDVYEETFEILKHCVERTMERLTEEVGG